MSVKRASSDPSSVRHRPAVMWIGVLTLLLSLFTPMITLEIADAAAAAERAQGVPPDCEDGYEPNDEGTECVPVGQNDNLQPECDPGFAYNDQSGQCEPEQPTCDPGFIYDQQSGQCLPEQPQCDPGTVYNQQSGQCEPEEQPITIQLNKWECDAEASQYLQDHGYLDQNCYQPVAPFNLWHGSPEGQENPVGVQGFWEWTDLAPGQHWIGEQPSEQYVVSVWCAVYDPNTGPTQAQQYTPDANGQVYFDVPSGWVVYCDWFNINAQDEDGGNSVTIYKWDCVEGTEYGQTMAYYQGEGQDAGPCETEHLNVPISLIHGGAQQDTTTQANGTQFNNIVLTNGSFQVAIDEPDGYGDPMVWCWPVEGDPPATPIAAPGGIFTITPGGEPFSWQCNVYDILSDGNSVTVYKWQCDEGTEFNREMDYYQGGLPDQETGPCETEHLNIPISLIHGGPQQDTTTQANGTQFNNVILTNGSFQISIDEPEGYGDPMVFCHRVEDDPSGTAIPAPGGVFTVTPGAEPFDYQCNVYDIPSDGNSVTIYKWQCVEGTEYNQTMAYYQGEGQDTGPCETEHLNVPISLIHGGPQQDTTTQANGTQFDDVILDNGSFQIAIDEPEGYGDPMVFCHRVEDDPSGTAIPAPGGVFSVTPGAQPFDYQCNVYDILSEGGSVTVYKWQCEPGTLYGQSLEYYQGGLPDQDTGPCETEHLNVPISLIHGGAQQDTTTQANGTQFNNVILTNGSFQIAIDEPDGYGDPMVWCWPVDGDPPANPIAAPGGTFTVTPGSEPFSWQCIVYDIPTDEGEYHLELYKYLCGPTVDRNLGLPDLGTQCAPAEGISFTAKFGDQPATAYYTDANGHIDWPGAPAGSWWLEETSMPGWGAPKVYCGAPQTTETPETTVTNLRVTGTLSAENPHIICTWFNFEEPYENGRITVYKYQCPPETTSTDLGLLQESCTTPHNGVGFTLTGEGTEKSASTVGGTVDWVNLDQGTYTVTESLWPGYGQPLVWCGYVMQDGADIDPSEWQLTSYPVTDASIQLELNNFPARIVCYWFNFPPGYGEITIYKWLCPPGYDIEAWGADPAVDCTEAWNGVTFTLDQPGDVDLMTDTGDSIPGAVYFGGLNPGAYTVTETVPPDIDYVFVLDCTGTDIPKVHQYPLSWGNKLDVNVAGGDSIVCHWYNVPEPVDGWVTVYKYQCWTSKFTSTVDCEIYEHGATFELFGMPGNTSYGTGTTNNGGLYTWNGLPEGAYTIDEISHKPCKITSTKVDNQGHAWVDAGEGTIIKVYNCKSSSTTTPTPGTTPPPKAPGKVPGKYPNTGVDPAATDNFMPSLQQTPVGTPPPLENDAPEDAYYRISCLNGAQMTATSASEPVASPTVTATEEAFDLPIDAEDDSTDTEGTPGTEEDCARGALPERVVIESANVDAGVETLEIVDGLMEQPTGPTLVTWYKETGRLGEPNNVVIAGHLNWWNVPEGVFYRLQDLQEGDRVEITGDDGMTYIYEVQWVRQESNLEPPAADVIGPTDEPSLTLITCGGEWNSDIAEYDERTVARAIQVDVVPAETADSSASGWLLAA